MAAARKARYRVRVAWDQNPVGLFTFDRSTFGGADTLAASGWSQTFRGTYDDITNDGAGLHVDRITITRGRENDLTASRAGEVTIEATDTDGKLNPRNTLGPLYGKLVSNRPLVVSAVFDGVGAAVGVSLITAPITDATRRAAVDGDGRAQPDSSFGFWIPTTNQITNGGFETGTAGWATDPGATITRDTTRSKFGGASAKITRGVTADAAYYGITLTSQSWAISAWVYVPAAYDGSAVRLQATQFAGGTITADADLSKRDQWQRVSLTFTPGGADLAGFVLVQLVGASSGKSIYIDGVQAEQQWGPTPYVETNGVAASRTDGSFVGMPTVLSPLPEKGWCAFRVRAGWPSTLYGASRMVVFEARDAAATTILTLYYLAGSWQAYVNGQSVSLVTLPDTFAAGDIRTIIVSWDNDAGTFTIWLGSGATNSDTAFAHSPRIFTGVVGYGPSTALSLNGDVLWAGYGTGHALTNAEAALVAAAAPGDPLPSDLPDGAAATSSFDTIANYVPDVETPLVYAWTDTIEHEPGQRKGKTTIHAFDLMTRMNEQKTALTSLGATTTGAAIGRLLDAMYWTDQALRSLSTGDQIPDFAPDGKNPILNEVESLIEPARGFFFISRTGAATFLSRDARSRGAVVGKVRNVMRRLAGGTDAADIINQWTIQRTDLAGTILTTTVKADDASIRKYGFQGGSGVKPGEITTPYLRTVGDAENLAAYLLNRTREPGKPIWELQIRGNVDAATLHQCLTRDLNDRVTIQEASGNTAGDHFVEQISHDITVGGAQHNTTWRMTERPSYALPFTFGISRFDGPDQLDWY